MREIRELDLFMMCPAPERGAMRDMPEGVTIRGCRADEYAVWRELHVDPADRAAYLAVLDGFFRDVYAPKGDLFFRQCRLALDAGGRAVGTCMIWRAYGRFSTLHWLKVLPECEGRGIGRALVSRVLSELADGEFPVYLHTHPSCFRAIKLYSDFGFRLLTDARVGARENGLARALPYLREHMPGDAFAALRFAEAGDDFLRAVAERAIDEF